MSIQSNKIQELIAKREKARVGGGEKAIEKQHAKGKFTARERIAVAFACKPSIKFVATPRCCGEVSIRAVVGHLL